MPLLAAILAGLLLGSFLNVCIARLPRHLSIAWPGSHCPLCGAAIRPFDNVPVLSFVLLRGRCRSCRGRISPRYPLVETGLAALFGACALRFAAPWAFAEAAALSFLLLGLLVTDWETLLLPDSLTLSGAGLGLAQAFAPGGGLAAELRLGAAMPFTLPLWPAWAGSVLGAALGAGLLLAVRAGYRLARKRDGMGLGDIKLAALLGAWMGAAGVLLTLALGIGLGALAGVTVLLRGCRGAGTMQLPFGSFLCAAGMVVLFGGRAILTWYFHFWR